MEQLEAARKNLEKYEGKKDYTKIDATILDANAKQPKPQEKSKSCAIF